MTHKLVGLEVTRVDLVDEGANSEAFIKIYKKKEGGKTMKLEEILKSLDEEQAKVIQAEIDRGKKAEEDLEKAKADLTASEQKVADLESEVNKSKKPEEEEEILKSVTPEVRAIIEKSRAQAKAAEESVKKMMEKESEKEAIAKAKEVSGVGTSEEDLASLYKSLSARDEKLAEKVFDVLKTAHSVIAESEVFKEAGSGGEGAIGEDAAWAKIEQKASEIAKSRTISKERAIDVVLEEYPEMYKEYIQAQIN